MGIRPHFLFRALRFLARTGKSRKIIMQRAVPLVRSVARLSQTKVPARNMGGHVWKPNSQVARESKAHMDFYPVPSGSWQEYHNKMNRKWNIQLAVSTALFAATWGYILANGTLSPIKMPEYKDVVIPDDID